jgi:hypothetical protein
MNSILQDGVVVTVVCAGVVLSACTAERGTVAADAAPVGDMVSLDGWGG